MAGDLTVEQAAALLGTTSRALRRRERLGLLPATRSAPGAHRRYGARALTAARLAADIEERHRVPPAALAFAVRAVVDPALAAEVRDLARAAGRDAAPTAALSFEQEKGQRLLERPVGAGRRSPTATPRQIRPGQDLSGRRTR